MTKKNFTAFALKVAATLVLVLLTTVKCDLPTKQIDGFIDQMLEDIKRQENISDSALLESSGWSFKQSLKFVTFSGQAMIKNLTLNDLKSTLRRVGRADHWDKSDYNSHIDFVLALGKLALGTTSSTSFAGLSWSNKYAGQVVYVELKFRIRCSKITDQLQMDTYEQKRFEGFSLWLDQDGFLAKYVPQTVLKVALRIYGANLGGIIEKMIRDHFKRGIPKFSQLRPLLCH